MTHQKEEELSVNIYRFKPIEPYLAFIQMYI
jgi:hypothetical protein